MHILLSAYIRKEERLTTIAKYPFQEVIWRGGENMPRKEANNKNQNEKGVSKH